ncbi:MAG: LysR family transcriptional regulator [Xanthobacteraceae bacterium]|nr:MAG: LysR family transcriptional regulator [Xanthobacteraceae bacterium]
MKASLVAGVTNVHRVTIDRGRTIGFMGDEGRVYGTPFLVLDMEDASRNLALAHSDAGEDSVGMDIAVKHIAATPLGWNVEITAKVIAVEGRKVTFELTAKDDLEVIGTAVHNRFIVDVAKTTERVKAKMAKRPA